MHDLHGAAAEDETGTDHHRITDAPRGRDRLLGASRHAVLGLQQLQVLDHPREPFTVLGRLDRVHVGPEDRDAILEQSLRQLQRRLPAELHDGPDRLLAPRDLDDVFERQRLEVEAVRRVVVGGHRLRIAVDHDAFEPGGAEREAGLDAAVVELDALADAVRARAEDQHLLARVWKRLVLVLVRRVQVRRVRLELGRAGVDPLVDRVEVLRFALASDVPHGARGELRDAPIGEPQPLPAPQLRKRLAGGDLAFRADQLFDLAQEPWVDRGELRDLAGRDPGPVRLADPEDPFGRRRLHLGPDTLQVLRAVLALAEHVAAERTVQAAGSVLEAAQSLVQRLVERPPDGHHLADGLHRRGERLVGMRELLEVEARHLHHAVVDRGLERARRRLGDVVLDLVERVPDGQLRGDARDGESGRLRGQRRAARYARVHLDDDDASGARIDAELDVRAACLDADGADHLPRHVAHLLVLDVAEGLRRCDGDRVPGVHAHRIDVLDRADDHHVVGVVAHHLQLEFLPPEHGLLDEHLVHRAVGERARPHLGELLAVVGDAAAQAAEGEAGPQDERESELVPDRVHLVERTRHARLGHVEADGGHRVLEPLPVLGFLDGVELRPDELRVVLGEDALPRELDREVQRGLPPERRQDGIRTLDGQDPLGRLDGDRLDVGAVGPLRVRHDGRGVRVEEDGPVAVLAERLQCLHSGVVELAGLPDDDGTRAEQEDGLQVLSARHS